MSNYKYSAAIILTLFLSSCSNFLTWHLDRGIHVANDTDSQELHKTEPISADSKDNVISNINLKIDIIYNKSINSGISGNSGYLHMKKIDNILYVVDTKGMLSGVDSSNGRILWSVDTNTEISSGLSIINDSICLGSANAELICYKLDSAKSKKYIPLISSLSNLASFTKYSPDVKIQLLTELASPIQSFNNLLLLKLDNDDLYLIDPDNNDVIWKSESQNISLRTKGASSPIIIDNTIIIARDNGSVSSYNAIDGTLKWFTIISSRSGRNDLESQRDAEMDPIVNGRILFYGHYQGELNALDLSTGNIIWASPFSFINDVIINENSVYGSTSDNLIVSVDKASGFINWKDSVDDSMLTEPFLIKDLLFVFSTEGNLHVYDKNEGNKIYEDNLDFDLHPQTSFILDKDKVYFFTKDGDIVHIKITI
jgi:outer membrane protein assembly factor BamB